MRTKTNKKTKQKVWIVTHNREVYGVYKHKKDAKKLMRTDEFFMGEFAWAYNQWEIQI